MTSALDNRRRLAADDASPANGGYFRSVVCRKSDVVLSNAKTPRCWVRKGDRGRDHRRGAAIEVHLQTDIPSN